MASTEIKQTAAVTQETVSFGLTQTKDAGIDLIAGAAGGMASVYVGQPLDTVKVKLQTFPSVYSGMTSCFLNTFRKDGVRGLYAGTAPALIANIAENSILFAAYGLCQQGVSVVVNKKDINNLSTLENASAGFFAAFFSSLALCPTELVKCRLQAMRELSLQNPMPDLCERKITPYQLTKSILRTEGVPGLFRGLTSTMAREMPGYFFFFGGYEASRAYFTPKGKTKDDLGVIETAICGGIAGITLWTAIFPTDVIKSRIQVTGSTEPMLLLFKQIIRTEGIRPLYNGLLPTIIRSFPATAALFIAYEYTKKFLHNITGNDLQ